MIATILFYTIPIIMGISVSRDINKNKHAVKDLLQIQIEKLIMSFIKGSLYLFIIGNLINAVSPANFVYNLKITILIIVIYKLLLIIYYSLRNIKSFYIDKWSVSSTIIIIVVNIVIYAVWRIGAATNTTLNWDLYHQQNIINGIVNNKFNYSPNLISDSFGFTSYTTLFHLLGSIPNILLGNINTLKYWYYLELFHLISTSFAMYYITKVFTKNKGIALLGAIMSSLMFESLGAYTTLFWIPQNIAATVGAFTIAKTIKERDTEGKIKLNESIIASLLLILTHYIMGTISVITMIGSNIFLYFHKKSSSISTILLIITILMGSGLIIASRAIDLSQLNKGEAASFMYSYYDKIEFLLDVYGLTTIIISLLSIVPILKDKSVHNNELKTLLVLNIVFLAVLFSSFPYVLKIFSIGRYFFIALFLYGLRYLLRNFNTKFSIFIITTLLINLSLIFILNITRYKQTPEYKDTYTHVSPYEIEASEFLKRYYTQNNTILISDPATMQIIEGLSGINSPGGAFASKETRSILSETYLTRDQNSYKKLNEIIDGVEDNTKYKNRILIISGRYEKWQKLGEKEKLGIVENIWKPKDLSYTDWKEGSYLRYLKEQTNIKIIYQNDGLIVFELPIE